MLPDNTLASQSIIGPFIGGRARAISNIQDYESGGVGLNDPSLGLDYQIWEGFIKQQS